IVARLTEGTIEDTLGHPTANVDPALAPFGTTVERPAVSVNSNALNSTLINPGAAYSYDSFKASALGSGAIGINNLTNLALGSTGRLNVAATTALSQQVTALVNAIIKVENSQLTS